MLSRVAWMAEELLRASQEKFNISQANHDSVERHICLLDQAIKEQEASLPEGSSRASLGTGDILPVLAISECLGKIRNTVPIAVENGLDGDQSTSALKKKVEGRDDGEKDSASLVITIPPQPVEELYCYCNRISFGEMIGCDSESCEREWFHLGCVGLTKPPGGKWFCEDCRTEEI
jgi:hypothetical protein